MKFTVLFLILSSIVRADDFRDKIVPYLKANCLGCHNDKKTEGDLSFAKVVGGDPAGIGSGQWRKAIEKIGSGEMPPEGRKRPEKKDSDELKIWVDARLTATAQHAKEVPCFSIRRLNRTEYRYTLLDLLGVNSRLAQELPYDAVEEGFDNNGRALFTTSSVYRKFYEAAAEAARIAIPTPEDTLKGPDGKPLPAPEVAQKIFVCRPGRREEEAACAKSLLTAFTKRAFRRTPDASEIDGLLKVYAGVRNDGESFEMGIRTCVQAVLQSFSFLYRVEDDAVEGVHPVSEYELASRLSYLLWISMPDDELLRLADEKKLVQQLDAQVARMLKDRKAGRFNEVFVSQWLQLRPLAHQYLRFDFFPGAREVKREELGNFISQMRRSMYREPIELFNHVRQNDLSVLEFIDADYLLVNPSMAKLYGIPLNDPNIKENDFVKVPAPAGRGGLITQAGALTVTSNPSRTSPVKRGKWILEVLLDSPPPEAPATVPPVEFTANTDAEGYPLTLRKRFEAHRSQESCRGCHAVMDPLGFGLEHFDPIGRWRDEEQAVEVRGRDRIARFLPIDATGDLPGGGKFSSANELKTILKKDPLYVSKFIRCLAKKLFVFATGRNFQPSDEDVLTSITTNMKAKNYSFSSALMGVIKSDPFLKRKKNQGE